MTHCRRHTTFVIHQKDQEMLTVHVKRLNEQAVIPTKAHGTDAGWDLYACWESWIDSDPTRVSTGISLAIPEGYYGQIQGRSGLASKGVIIFPGVIDAGYRGPIEVVMSFVPTDDFPGDEDGDYAIKSGDKIAQMVILPVPQAQMVDIGGGDLPHGERGEKGFGDSDRVQASVSGYFSGPQDPEFWSGQDDPDDDEDLDDDDDDDELEDDGDEDEELTPDQMLKIAQDESMSLQKANAELTWKLQEVTGKLEVAQCQLSKTDQVSGRVYRSLKEAYLELEKECHQKAQDALTTEFRANTRLNERVKSLDSELAQLRANPPDTQDMVPRKGYDGLMSLNEQLNAKVDSLEKELAQAYRMAYDIHGSSYRHMAEQFRQYLDQTKDELSRVKIRLANDQADLKKARDVAASLEQFLRGAKKSHDIVRDHLDGVLEVMKVIRPRYLEDGQWDVINAAFDALGKPSPFFKGNRVMKPMG